MEDNKPQSLDSEIAAVQGSGSILAAERKRQKRNIEDIGTELNLSLTQLRTIESDQTDGLPEPTYVRGYIRSYAKLLGLNPDEVLKHYLNPSWQQSNSLNEIPKRIGSAEESRGRVFTKRRILTSLLLLGLLGVLWFSGILPNYFGLGSSDSQTISTTSSDPVDAAPANVDAQEDTSLSGIDKNDAKTAAASDQPTDAEQAVDQPKDQTTAAAEISTASDESKSSTSGINELLLTFSKTSWVDIRDEQDNRLAYKSYAKGEELRVDSETALSVFIGNADGVSVEYNGAPFDLTEFREGVYAKFSVGE